MRLAPMPPFRLAGPLLALLLLAPLLLAARPAQAQIESREAIRLENQILELRHELQSLRDQMGQGVGSGGSALGGGYRSAPPPSGNAPASDVVAGLVDRMARLEDQMRSLQGRIDEADNARKTMQADLQKQIDDLNYKLGGGIAPGVAPGAPAGAAPGAPTAPGMSPPPGPLGKAPPAAGAPPARPHRTPELAMQEGNAALARRDYATAQAAAKEVLAMPRSPRANDAQFLLAQALAGKKDYAGAAVAYDDTYNRAKTGPHAQDALLGLAHSLISLNEKRAACVTLDKLHAEFRSPRRDVAEQATAARKQAGCR